MLRILHFVVGLALELMEESALVLIWHRICGLQRCSGGSRLCKLALY